MALQTCHNGSHTQEYAFTAGGVLDTRQRGAPQCVSLSQVPSNDPAISGEIVKGKSFSLWVKNQPAGAIAVFLLSNSAN